MCAAMILKLTPELDSVRRALVEAINSQDDQDQYNLKALSLQIGRGQSYLFDFVYKGKPRRLHPDDRRRLATILGLEEATLMSQDDIKRIGKPDGHPVHRAPDFQYEKKDLPIMGRAQGAQGDVFTLEGGKVGVTERPSYLEGIQEAFAVYVAGDSMSPRFKAGEMVYINPVRPPVPGDDVLVEFLDGTGIIKELVKIAGSVLTVHQHNPAQNRAIDLKKVKKISLIQGSRPRT